MKKNIYTLLLFAIILASCSSKREELALTFVLDTPISSEKYPTYFKDMVMPFKDASCETDFLLKPISFVRADIKRTEVESNAWHFAAVGDNTVEFSKGWLQQFFTDSLTPSFLKKTLGGRKIKLDSYLKKKDEVVILYSEESELDEYQGVPVFHTSKEVKSKIQETACSNTLKKVTVLINPSELSKPPPSGTTTGGSETPLNPCGVNTVASALDLKTKIEALVDVNQSDAERLQKAKEIWNTFFDPKAYVASYKDKNDENPDVYNPGEGKQYFTSKLAVLESIHSVGIFRLETSKKSGKISGIHIVECHDASEVQ